MRVPLGAVSRRKQCGIDQVENAESCARRGFAASASAGLLIRRSLVRAQVGEPSYMGPAAMLAALQAELGLRRGYGRRKFPTYTFRLAQLIFDRRRRGEKREVRY
jgi:hypothetical protein